MDETAAARVTGVAQVLDLHTLKAFAPDKRVRKMLFMTDQVMHDGRNPGSGRRVIMFLKVNPRILSAKADG